MKTGNRQIMCRPCRYGKPIAGAAPTIYDPGETPVSQITPKRCRKNTASMAWPSC